MTLQHLSSKACIDEVLQSDDILAMWYLSFNPWAQLAIAIVFEIAATLMLKQSDGFQNTDWAIGSIICYIICFWFFAPALKALPVGVAYAIWSGVGIAAVAVFSWFVFDQNLTYVQMTFIALILASAIGLNLTTEIEKPTAEAEIETKIP